MFIFLPSFVTFSLPLRVCKRRFFSSSAFCFAVSSAVVFSSGSTNISPVKPSTIAKSPSFISDRNLLPTPITAGMFIFLARIAVCEFDEPCAVTKASTLSLSRDIVSLGARSSAQTIILSSPAEPSLTLPMRFAIILLEISFTSAALACI